ncbi:MAG: tRNA pseudouridine(38-40) synthase TruA [Flavobacteriales bacterium]|nr:tRNA pseudouridine(38-40) synthase TruA [Flavobacteriales bacterium]MDW8410079.1 tRNA pseudouridine(38-40) synthase TruA [Flavobacteriales bacterium]
MPRYFLRVMYEGSSFVGWQRQKNGLSVQEVLEEVLSHQLRHPVQVVATGRTDSGVHARAMVVHADFPKVLQAPGDFLHKTNSHLPKALAITGVRRVKPDAHARYDAFERVYEYRLCYHKNPFEWGRAWMLFRRPDLEKMKAAAQYFLGRHDYSAFCSARSATENKICYVKEATIHHVPGYYSFWIRADRFLMNMVRTMVGTLVEIGLGKRPPESIPEILKSTDRRRAGAKAPAEGLYFVEAKFPDEVFEEERWYEIPT